MGSPGGARAGRVERSRCPCAWHPAGAIGVRSTPACGIRSQLPCTPFCLVPAVVVSHQAWNWAGEGESPSPSLQFCSGGSCESWRDPGCQLCSQYRGPGCACCFLCHPCPLPPWLALELGSGLTLSQGSDPHRGVPLPFCTLAVPWGSGSAGLLASPCSWRGRSYSQHPCCLLFLYLLLTV